MVFASLSFLSPLGSNPVDLVDLANEINKFENQITYANSAPRIEHLKLMSDSNQIILFLYFLSAFMNI
jgi:hypothetical protein